MTGPTRPYGSGPSAESVGVSSSPGPTGPVTSPGPASLSNGRLADGRAVDIDVGADGTIRAVTDHDPSRGPGRRGTGDPVIDLDGWLVLPAMGEPHAHLDKALTADEVVNPTGDLMGAIGAWVEASAAGRLDFDDRVTRAERAMANLLVRGVTVVRTHVDVHGRNRTDDPTLGLRAVREAASRFEGMLEVQTVALPATPITGREGAANRRALAAALEFGVDHVGGCPHLDPDGPTLITQAVDAATEAGIGIDLHVDEMLDPAVLTLRDYARQVIDRGFAGPVAAGHCVTLGMQASEVQRQVSALVAEAGIPIFPLPQTNLYLQGRDADRAVPRGLTAIGSLVDAGALVAAGADNVQDPFNLMGRSDPLETAALLVMAGHRSPVEAYDMVSNNVRRAVGLPTIEFRPGDPGDLVAIDAGSVRGAVAEAPMSRRVFHRGRLVASCDQKVALHKPGPDDEASTVVPTDRAVRASPAGGSAADGA